MQSLLTGDLEEGPRVEDIGIPGILLYACNRSSLMHKNLFKTQESPCQFKTCHTHIIAELRNFDMQ